LKYFCLYFTPFPNNCTVFWVERCEFSEETSASFFRIEKDMGGASWAVSTKVRGFKFQNSNINLFPQCNKYLCEVGIRQHMQACTLRLLVPWWLILIC